METCFTLVSRNQLVGVSPFSLFWEPLPPFLFCGVFFWGLVFCLFGLLVWPPAFGCVFTGEGFPRRCTVAICLAN